MGIRNAGVFCYLNTTRWLRALGIRTGPKTLHFEKAAAKYTGCILDLTLVIHTICLSQAEMFKYSLETAAELVLEKIRLIILAKLKATNLVVFCLDSPAGSLKFAVSAQRAHHRQKWEDSPFVAMLKDPSSKEFLFGKLVNYVRQLSFLRPEQTVVVIQRNEQGVAAAAGADPQVYGSEVSGVGGQGWFVIATGSPLHDPEPCRLRALFQCFLDNLGDSLQYESDMLCYQVAELISEQMARQACLPVLVESKDTDMAAIFLARYGSMDLRRRENLRRVHLLFRSFKKFVEVDMDASLSQALSWLDVPTTVFPSQECPLDDEREALLWLLDFDEWTPLMDEFCVPVMAIKCFVSKEAWKSFLAACARSCTRGPLFRRTMVYLNSCVTSDRLPRVLAEACATGCPVYEYVIGTLGMSESKLQNDGFCASQDNAAFTFVEANPVKDKRQSASVIMNLTHQLYASGMVPRSSYQRYCEERYNMLDDNGVCMRLDTEASPAACCAAAVGLSMYGTDYANGLPSVGERQVTAALSVEYLFREMSRFCALSALTGEDCDKVELLTMVSRFFGLSPNRDLSREKAARLINHALLPYRLWTEDSAYCELKRRVQRGEDLSDICVDGATLEIVNIKNDFQTTRGRPQYALTLESGDRLITESSHSVNTGGICDTLDRALGQLEFKLIREVPPTFQKLAKAAAKRTTKKKPECTIPQKVRSPSSSHQSARSSSAQTGTMSNFLGAFASRTSSGPASTTAQTGGSYWPTGSEE
ncbi:protein Allo54 [Cyprinid herpesvirus 1]|uniref:Protein Allo54 n=1 Tax=Cyprinid herpesvirus 1 TaxID=317858 RepID=K7PCK4_9VIRU|nr:protein Allo54 [Cyprinid herpesvirus 1]AFJ20360.1 protein Allo54 [Cyprinid herpesvirus 1]